MGTEIRGSVILIKQPDKRLILKLPRASCDRDTTASRR